MFRIKTLKAKITTVHILLILIIILIGIISCFNVYGLGQVIDGLMTDNYKSIAASNSMSHSIEEQDKAALTYIESLNSKDLNSFYIQNDEFYKWFDIEKNNITEAGEEEIVQRINTHYIDFIKIMPELQDFRNNHKDNETLTFYNTTVLPKVNNVKKDLKDLSVLNEKAMFNGKNKAKSNAGKALYIIFFVSLLAAAAGLVISIYSTDKSLKPIHLLSETIKSVKEGELYKQAPVINQDEIGMLSNEFNNMTKRLYEFEQSTTGSLLAEKNKSVAIVKSIADPLLVLDKSYKIVLINKSCEELFNLKEKDVLNKHILETVRNMELYDYIFDLVNKDITDDEKIINININNENFYFNILATAALDKENKISSIVVLLKNVTKFKMLENIRADFIATVSHEFKTPLTSIMMGAGLMLNKNIGELNEQQKDLLFTIKDETQKLTELVANLLRFSRIQSDKTIFDIKPNYIYGIVNSCINNYLQQAESKDVTIYDNTAEDLPMVKADEEKISWVLNNLVSNALKYTNAGDEIVISASVKDGLMYIFVKDTGVGIPPEYIQKIFDKFVKVRGFDKELISTGLGLSIAKEIVEAHGGTIWCESILDEGSTFTFTLPIVKNQK